MRLIDANTLRAEFTGNFNSGYYTVPEIWATIDTAPTIGGWISVKDRLPEINEEVLAYARGKNDPIYRIVIESMSDRNIFDYRLKTEPYWREPWQFFNTMYEITHWMPLPEPPKEVCNNEV